jgi:putative N-acetyltransferase (TIGR04045 family)
MRKLTITSVIPNPAVSCQLSAINCREVRTELELRECYKIRKKVFVEEQKLFSKTDRDRYDAEALHIAAFQGKRIIGTVRIYQQEKDVWFGGRLAVLKGFRGRAGRLLIEKAIEVAKRKKAKRFLAYVQVKNVSFFKRCGWSEAGEAFPYHGVPHQMMEAELKKGFQGSRVQVRMSNAKIQI